MRQAIETKYLGATNYRPSRIVARTEGGHRLIVSYDHAHNPPQMHQVAAEALANKLEWTGQWVGAGTREGYVFVQPDGDVFEVTP